MSKKYYIFEKQISFSIEKINRSSVDPKTCVLLLSKTPDSVRLAIAADVDVPGVELERDPKDVEGFLDLYRQLHLIDGRDESRNLVECPRDLDLRTRCNAKGSCGVHMSWSSGLSLTLTMSERRPSHTARSTRRLGLQALAAGSEQ